MRQPIFALCAIAGIFLAAIFRPAPANCRAALPAGGITRSGCAAIGCTRLPAARKSQPGGEPARARHPAHLSVSGAYGRRRLAGLAIQSRSRPLCAGRAGAFLAEIHRIAPEIRVIPWTGGNLGRDVHLDDAAQRRAFAEHARRLVALGADGIQLNVEPLPSGTPPISACCAR